jgi:hypothetical protein
VQVSPGPDPERDRRPNGPHLPLRNIGSSESNPSQAEPSRDEAREAKQATAGDEESGVVASRIEESTEEFRVTGLDRIAWHDAACYMAVVVSPLHESIDSILTSCSVCERAGSMHVDGRWVTGRPEFSDLT